MVVVKVAALVVAATVELTTVESVLASEPDPDAVSEPEGVEKMVLVPTAEVMVESPETMVDRRVSVEMGIAPPAPSLPEPVADGSRLEKIVVLPTVVVTTPSLPEIVERSSEVAMAMLLGAPSAPVAGPVVVAVTATVVEAGTEPLWKNASAKANKQYITSR